MKVIAHENWIELVAESVMENEAIRRWQECRLRVRSAGVACKVPVPWSPDPADVFGLSVAFDPKPEEPR